jgi:hypothetical protein
MQGFVSDRGLQGSMLQFRESRQPYRVNFLMTMGEFGTMHWNPEHTMLLPSPMPWMRLLLFCVISLALLSVALGVTKRQDF